MYDNHTEFKGDSIGARKMTMSSVTELWGKTQNICSLRTGLQTKHSSILTILEIENILVFLPII